MAPAVGAHVAGNDARVAADGVAVDGVIDAAVTDPRLFHGAHDGFEGFGVVGSQPVQLHVADVPAVGQRVVGRFAGDLLEDADLVIHGHVE